MAVHVQVICNLLTEACRGKLEALSSVMLLFIGLAWEADLSHSFCYNTLMHTNCHRRAFTIPSLRHIDPAYISYLQLATTAQAYLSLLIEKERDPTHRVMLTTVFKGRTPVNPRIGYYPKEWLRGLLPFDKKTSRVDERWRRHGQYRKTSTSPIFHAIKSLCMDDPDNIHLRFQVSSQA